MKEIEDYLLTAPLGRIAGSERFHRQVSKILRLAGFLTDTDLDLYFEEYQVSGRVFRQRMLERDFPNGTPLIAVTNLDPVIRHFLCCKGFTDDIDLIRLEKIAGSLAVGICMLTHI
jgi:hypothetical protein